MITVILTVKPKYARLIYAGTKPYELRKDYPQWVRTHPGAFRVLICESGTGGEITGEFTCPGVVGLNKRIILPFLQKNEGRLGVTTEQAPDYADGKPLYAWCIEAPKLYTEDKVITVQDYGLRRAPQSWCYV